MRNVWISTDLHLLNGEINSHHPYRSIGNIGRLTDGYAKDVQVNDVFIYLGDLYDPSAGDPKKIKAVISAIPGYKIMCKGNHDTESDSFYQELGFDLVCDVATYHNIAISHKPIIVPPDMVNIHGHVHTEKFSYLGHQHINAYDPEFTTHPTLLDDLLARAESAPNETKWAKNPWDYTAETTAFESFQAFDKSKYFNVVSIDDIIDTDVPTVALEESVLTEGTAELVQLKKMTSPTDLSDWMRKNIKYASFTRLMTTAEILKKKRGSCHDQVAFEFPILKGMGVTPKVLFMIATKPDSNQGGMTHSLIYWQDANDKVYWFENAWNIYQGIHEYESYEKMKEDIEAQYAKTSGSSQFPELVFKKTSIAHFKPGADLRTLVDGIMNNKILEAAIAAYMPTQLDEVIFQDADDVEYFEQDDEYRPSSRKKEPMADGEGTMDESATFADVKFIVDRIPKEDHHFFYHGSTFKDSPYVIYRDAILIKNRGKEQPPENSGGAFIDVYTFKDDPETGIIVIAASPIARGKGYTDKLVKKAIPILKKRGIKQLLWRADNDNIHSIRLAERLGFTNETDPKKNPDQQRFIMTLNEASSSVIKVPKVLYHGSSKKFGVVKANSAYNLPSKAVEAGTMVAYGSPSYEFALCYAGDEWSDFDINQSVVNGQVVLTEILPGAFKDTFNRPGYIYHMDGADFIAIDKHSEFVCPHDVTPTKVEKISNVWSKILKSNIKLHMYPDLPRWIPDRTEYLKELCMRYGRDYTKISAMLKLQGVKLDESVVKTSQEPQLYFVSPDSDWDESIISPRIPDNYMTKNGYEDNTTPRVCFSTSIDGCLRALSQNCVGMELYVFTPVPTAKKPGYEIITPTAKQVPDVKLTNERWICHPVELTCVGKIKVTGNANKPGMKYKYGNKTAKLYDWNWEWIDRYDNLDESAYAKFRKDHESSKFDPERFKIYYLPRDKAKWNEVFSPGNKYQQDLHYLANNGRLPKQKDDEWGKGVFVVDKVTGYLTGWGFVFSNDTIANVDVLDGYRGMSIGTEIIKELKQMGGNYLEVDRKNKVATEMYLKLGYKEYYRDKHAIYMSTTGKCHPDDKEWFEKNAHGKAITENAKNDEGKAVPETCPECGAKVKIYFKGEPVYLCSNEKCGKYFGVVPFHEDAADIHPIDREQQDKIADKYGLQSPGHASVHDDEPKKSAAQIAKEKRDAQRKKDLEKARKEKRKKAFVNKLKSMLPGKKNEDADAAGTEWYDEPEIEENPLGARAHFFNHPDRYTEVIAETGYKFELIDNVTFYDKVNEAAAADDKLYPVYIMLVHSGTLLANAIKFATNSHFSHSSISFDSSMHNMYSFGRKENTNPFIGAFKREDIRDRFFKERQITYALYVVPCTKEEFDLMKKRLDYFMRNGSKFKYDFTGLFKNYFGIADNPEYKWFCSRFVADIINAGRPMNPYIVEPSLMKPEDFSNTTFAQYVTGGYINSYDSGFVDRVTKRILRTEKLKRAQNKALESMQNETAILDVDSYNPFLESTINIQLTRMDESVVDSFVEYMQSMKVRFDNQGNVIITRRETDQLSMHFKRSLKMIKACEKAGNVEGVKEELYRINYMINLIDTHYLNPKVVSSKRVKDDLKKEMVDLRSVMLNALGQHLKYVTTREPQYNFKTSYEASVYGKDVVIPKTVYSSIGKAILTALK